MELTIEQLYSGKATRIKDREYFSSRQYTEPFLDGMSKFTDNFIINAKPADQVSLTKDGEINLEDCIWNRVWIQAVMPKEYVWEGHNQVVSMLYALDARKPVVKIYNGALNSACLNLCVFNPDMLDVKELEPETQIDFSPVKRVMSATEDIHAMLERLSNMTIEKHDMFDQLGHWIDRCITCKTNFGFGSVKLAESAPVEVYKDLFYDEKSDYYTTENEVDGFTIYNAFTKLITDDKRDIVNKAEKTLLIKDILGL